MDDPQGPEVLPVSSPRPAGTPASVSSPRPAGAPASGRGWIRWAGALLVALALAYLAGALLLRVPGVARATDSPEFCGQCHIMEAATLTHARSAHRSLTCGECHVRHEFLATPYSKGSQGIRHVAYLMAGFDERPLRASPTTQATVQENCLNCHGPMFPGVLAEATARSCTDCHRDTPHGRVKP